MIGELEFPEAPKLIECTASLAGSDDGGKMNLDFDQLLDALHPADPEQPSQGMAVGACP